MLFYPKLDREIERSIVSQLNLKKDGCIKKTCAISMTLSQLAKKSKNG